MHIGFRKLALCLVLIGLLAGCSGSKETVPDEPPHEVGHIRELKGPAQLGLEDGTAKMVGLLRVLVEGQGRRSSGEPRLWLVTVGEDTQLLHITDKVTQPVKHTVLREGQTVQVWFKPGVEDSYPAQVYAQVIAIME